MHLREVPGACIQAELRKSARAAYQAAARVGDVGQASPREQRGGASHDTCFVLRPRYPRTARIFFLHREKEDTPHFHRWEHIR